MNELAHVLIVEDNEDDYEATRRSFVRNHLVNPLIWSCSAEDGPCHVAERKGVLRIVA